MQAGVGDAEVLVTGRANFFLGTSFGYALVAHGHGNVIAKS